MSIPISAVFIGLNGLIAFVLSYVVVMERMKTRLWHGENETEVANQPKYAKPPSAWAAFIERYLQKSVAAKTADDGVLQRKVRAYGNFTEYVPLALLLILALELMQAAPWLIWLMGGALTFGRVAHAWGLIATYGPSPGRAIGFFLTWFVYIVGSAACLFYGIVGLF